MAQQRLPRPKSLYASSSHFLPLRDHFLKMAASLAAGARPQQRVRPTGEGGSGRGACSALLLRLLGTLAAGGLEQEPAALFRLVDKVREQARGGDIVVLVRDLVCLPEIRDDGLVVVHQFHQHARSRNKILIVVLDPLQARDLPDRADGRAADLANALRQNVAAA